MQSIVKLQRPLFTTDDINEVMSYLVNENDEQISEPVFTKMPMDQQQTVFAGNHAKAYYLAEYDDGISTLIEPIWLNDWV